MGKLNIIGSAIYNIGTTSSSYTATSGATAIATIEMIDKLPGCQRKLRDQTGIADLVEKFSPSRRVKVTDTQATVFLADTGYTSQDMTATSNFRIDIPTDASTTTSSVTYLQIFCPASAIVVDEPAPGGEDKEVVSKLTIAHGAKPTYATAAY